MPDLSAERRLVKSPPELWAELSEVERLAKHLGAFGEIRITKLDPERSVVWEGDHVSGTVSIEASGWGTKVTLTAEVPGDAPPPEEFETEPEETQPEVPAEDPVEEEFERPAPPEEEPAGPDEAARASEPPGPTPAPPRSLDDLAPLVGRRQPRLLSRLFAGWRVAPLAPEPVQRQQDWLEHALVDSAVSAHAGQPEADLFAANSVPTPKPQAQPLEPAPEPEADLPETQLPEPEQTRATTEAQAVLDSVLDTLGSAHHRPFSRG
jgi:hypothetical protein